MAILFALVFQFVASYHANGKVSRSLHQCTCECVQQTLSIPVHSSGYRWTKSSSSLFLMVYTFALLYAIACVADNFCFYNSSYDSLDAAAGWAKDSLDLHSTDVREHIYSEDQLDKAQTHDDLWNAAQVKRFLRICLLYLVWQCHHAQVDTAYSYEYLHRYIHAHATVCCTRFWSFNTLCGLDHERV